MAAHPVIAVAPISDDMEHAESRIRNHFSISLEHGIIQEAPEYYFRNLLITDDYARLKDCKLIIECTKWLICKFSLDMYTRFPHLQ